MKRKIAFRKNKGITLIALVVTIVVLLILAGVSINLVLGKDGIIEQAQLAAEKTKEAEEQENKDLDNLIDQMNSILDKTPDPSDEPEEKNAIAKEYGIKQKNENKTIIEGDKSITIPKGYTIVDPSTDNTIEYADKNNPKIDEGIVIKDDAGNEFVWVPVPNPENMYGTDSNESNVNEKGERYYLGKLYNFTSSETTNENWEELGDNIKWSNETGYREPDVVTTGSDYDADESNLKRVLDTSKEHPTIEDFKIQLKTEFKDMCDSVAKYKGFYVGRYETSLSEGKSASKKGVESLTNVSTESDWYGQYKYNKAYAQEEENSSVVSSSIWGSQYDAMIKWMQDIGINVDNTIPKEGLQRNTTNITGSEPKDKLCNIYDLLGNSYEWTMEVGSITDYNGRVYRGGYADSGHRIKTRIDVKGPTSTSGKRSSRLSLWIQ